MSSLAYRSIIMKKLVLIFLLFGIIKSVIGQTAAKPAHPFPSAITKAGKPNSLISDATVLNYFKRWTKSYLVHTGNQAYVLNDEKKEKGVTTSEAAGYGMLIEVIMAAADPNAQANFDALYRYARAHHVVVYSQADSLGAYLMSWRQYGSAKDEKDSAVDGDLDIAYALLLANAQWGKGVFNYLDCAMQTIKAIKTKEMDTIHYRILRGSADGNDTDLLSRNAIRLSDFMPDHFRAFATATKDSFWTRLTQINYRRYDQIQQKFSPVYGLFPEYVLVSPEESISLVPNSIKKKTAQEEGFDDGGGNENPRGQLYGFNSSRVPWRLAADYFLNSNDTTLRIIRRLNAGMRIYADSNACWLTNIYPLEDSSNPDQHRLKIQRLADNATADLNVIAPLCAALSVEGESKWQTELDHRMIDDPAYHCNTDPDKIPERNYYENTLRLLCMLLITQNYWQPPINSY